MNDFEERMYLDEVKTSLSLYKWVKWSKVLIACVIAYAYFTDASWIIEIIVFSVILNLILPLSFFDVFIQKLLEYNTKILEKRQRINVEEANEHFEHLYRKVGK